MSADRAWAPLAAVLFDLDGTLVDTTDLIHQSMRHASLAIMGRVPPREELLANVGQPLMRMMELLDHERADLLFAAYKEHNLANHDRLIREFPGVVEALARLRRASVKVAVVTSKHRPMVRMALDAIPRIEELIDHFGTAEDTKRHKPHPEPLLNALEVLGVSPAEAAYVGDAPTDVLAASAAGVTSVAVSWGLSKVRALRAVGPDHLVPDLAAAVETLLGEGDG